MDERAAPLLPKSNKDFINSSRKENALNSVTIDDILKQDCCRMRCTFEVLTPEIVLRWRQKYHTLPKGLQQRLKLMELFKDTAVKRNSHIVEGNCICSKAWYRHLMGVSKRTYIRTKASSKLGIQILQQRTIMDTKGMIAKGFMTNYVSFYGEVHPESGNTLLPVGVTLRLIYNKYSQRYSEVGDVIKYAQFHNIWKRNFRHVKQQKVSKMAKCDVCTLAKGVMPEITAQNEKDATQTDWDEHLERQRQARDSYYARRDHATSDANVTSLIIDGMDQSKTNLPHFVQAPKCLDAGNMLKTHLTGVFMHPNHIDVHVDLHQFPHDSNMTINCMFRSLWNRCGHQLTKTIYIQMDNCGRENKNRFLFAALALLVKFNKTREIIINFLMVGHTHEDIDQKFSIISKSLKRRSAKTLPQLKLITTEAGMNVYENNYIYDVKHWLGPYLNEGLHNHSYNHSFRLTKDKQGDVVMHFKKWPMDPKWLPEAGDEQIDLFRRAGGVQLVPSGVPPAVEPSWVRNNLTQVMETIKKVDMFFSEEEKHWWNNICRHPPAATNPDWEWPLLNWVEIEAAEETLTPFNQVTPLTHVMRKERQYKRVYSGKKSTRKDKPLSKPQPNNMPVIGHVVVFSSDGIARFGELSSILDSSNVKVFLYRRVGDCLEKAKTMAGNAVEKEINSNSIFEDLTFVLPRSFKIPSRIKIALSTICDRL